ncbi:MAG: phosphatase, partial [Frankia sp.]|nr:phosphatase [Frankia sp.]
ETVRAAFPDDGFVGEELGATGPAERTWLIDPLCGTRNFAAQTQQVAVNVALRAPAPGQPEGWAVRVAACADPFTDEIFWTDGERVLLRHAGQDTPVKPSGASALVDINLDDLRHQQTTVRMLALPAFAQAFRPRVVASSLALAWVAVGRRAAYLSGPNPYDGDPRTNVHFAAGLALCAAAGCVVTGLRGHSLDTTSHGLIAAADPATHAALVAIAEEAGVADD